MVPNGVFFLFSTNFGKVLNHPVHKTPFGLAYIVHPTLDALYGIDQVIGPASNAGPGSEYYAIRVVPYHTTGIQFGAIVACPWGATAFGFFLLGLLLWSEQGHFWFQCSSDQVLSKVFWSFTSEDHFRLL